jgi:hypothetical protein
MISLMSDLVSKAQMGGITALLKINKLLKQNTENDVCTTAHILCTPANIACKVEIKLKMTERTNV